MKNLVPILQESLNDQMLIYVDDCSVQRGVYVMKDGCLQGFVTNEYNNNGRSRIIWLNGATSINSCLKELISEWTNHRFYDLPSGKYITLNRPSDKYLLKSDLKDNAQIISIKKSDGKIGTFIWNKEYSLVHSDFDFYLITD